MKKPILLMCAIVPLLFTACEKKYCWKCAVRTQTRTSPASSAVYTGYTNDTTFTNETLCDETQSDITKIETPIATIRTSGNIIISTNVTTTCNK